MIQPLFNCSQQLMYRTTKTMWINCKENIGAMGLFKTFYTEDYCDERIAEIEAAEAMKSEAARILEREMLRLELVELADVVRGNWQALKLYIAFVYKTKEAREYNWRSAGWSSYESAGEDNWTSVQTLISEGNKYITNHTATLTANSNMPSTFAATFAVAGAAFNSKLNDFTQADQQTETDTNTKNTANNEVYKQAIEMGQDGQFVMRRDESMRKRFSFEAVSEMAEPKGTSTVVVELKDEETNQVIEKFVLMNMETGRTVDAVDGRAEMGLQAGGQGKHYKIVADGFAEKTITVNLNTGVKVVEHVTVMPLIGAAARAEIAVTASTTPTTEMVAG